jgi:hypothetical protein
MKKIFFILVFFSASVFISSCEKENKILSSDEFFVAFGYKIGVNFFHVANINKASTDTLKIPVYVAAEKGPSMTVTIGVNNDSTTAVLGTDYEFVRGPLLTYPIGAGYDSIMIIPKTGGTAGNLKLDLFLESNSAGYTMGFKHGEEADSTSFNKFRVNFIQ